MDKRIGVYLCSGCGIGDCLDLANIRKVVIDELGVAMCKHHPQLCGMEGKSIINKDVAEGINTVVIGACSPRVQTDVFTFSQEIVLERVNLREHVIWSHPPKDEDTQMLAEDYLRMGVTRASKVLSAEPYLTKVDKTILVVGGGITGITSALEGAKAGYNVYLVEKSPDLGGWMAKWHKQYPQKPPYQRLEDTDITTRIKEVRQNSRIRIFTGAEIAEISGSPGMFNVSLRQDGKTVILTAGSIVLATGFRPYDADRLGYLGYGKFADIITSVKMEELAQRDKIKRPSDGKEIESIAFIQCAGQRDNNHLPYCSSFCCLTSLKQALYVKEQNPTARIYVIYKDIRTPAQYEEFFKQVQDRASIVLIKGEVRGISEDEGKNLILEIADTLLDETVAVKVDLAVLAIGMVPSTMPEAGGIDKATCATEAQKEYAPDSGFFANRTLNLKYRQGPELPTLKYGFPDSHFICFPYETRRTGIYAAGCVRQPMDSANCIEDATGSALKAIQCIELIARGQSVHPRTWDKTYPELFMQRCTQCKRCTEECPFGMYDEDEKFNPLSNPTRCRRCAICLGACPERIISFKDFSIDIVSSMVKAIKVPVEEDEKPRIIAFLCENDAYPALDMAGLKHLKYNPFIRVIPVRCLGSVNVAWIVDALSQGIDGILLIGCQYGEDYHCHFIKGSELANYRMNNIQEALQRLALERERIQVLQLAISEYDKLPRIFDDFLSKINDIGPNPYKGF